VLKKVLCNRCQISLSNYTFGIIFFKLTFSNDFVSEPLLKGYLTMILSPKLLLNTSLITVLCQKCSEEIEEVSSAKYPYQKFSILKSKSINHKEHKSNNCYGDLDLKVSRNLSLKYHYPLH
jgi:hypothetical protein